MAKSILPILYASLITFALQSQTACPPGEPLSDYCASACAPCDWSAGIIGNNAGGGLDWPQGFCGTVQTNKWIRFTAARDKATFTLTPLACQWGDGLQLALYDDCKGQPLFCNGGNGTLSPVTLSNVPLVPGRTYFLTINGNNGDICEFLLEANPLAAVQPAPLGNLSAIQGPSSICPSGVAAYSVAPVSGATAYTWNAPSGAKINGMTPPVTLSASTGQKVNIQFSNGSGNITVRAGNDCYASPQLQSKAVSVRVIPPTTLPRVDICSNELPYMLPWGEVITKSGTYTYYYVTYQGCDSLIRQTVNVYPSILVNIPTRLLCPNDSMLVCGQWFKDPGNYEEVCTSWRGCDSTIRFSIIKPVASIQGGGSLNCFNGAVTLSSTASIGGGTQTKIWRNAAGQAVGTGNTYTATVAGKYTLEVTTTFAGRVCTATSDYVVKETDSLQVSLFTPNLALACNVNSIKLNAQANMPATYLWQGPNGFTSNLQAPTVSQAGIYTLTASTAGGCSKALAVTVTSISTPLTANVTSKDLSCIDPVVIPTVTIGGNYPAQQLAYAWTGPGNFASNVRNPSINREGTYTLTVTHVPTGCKTTATLTVQRIQIPNPVSISGQNTLTCARKTIVLQASAFLPSNYIWSGPNGFAAYTGQTSIDKPGAYTVVAVAIGNGCIGGASINITADVTPPTVRATGGTLGCNPPEVMLNSSVSGPAATYVWSGPGGFYAPTNSPLVREIGTYSLTATGVTNGCMATAQVQVLENGDAPQVFLNVVPLGTNQRQLVCNTTAIGPEFLWTGPNNFTSTQQNPVVNKPGVYSVLVTDALSNCQTYRSINVPGLVAPNNSTAARSTPSGTWVLAPNPVYERAELRFVGAQPPASTRVQVLDATGRRCWEGETQGTSTLWLDLQKFPSGLYRVVLQSDTGTDIKPLVKIAP